jgi:hypothetical protein
VKKRLAPIRRKTLFSVIVAENNSDKIVEGAFDVE